MVKLDDVAKLAGVSKGTASRVLNNRGYISQQTRERIEAAVKELNYYPNENARNLLKRHNHVSLQLHQLLSHFPPASAGP